MRLKLTLPPSLNKLFAGYSKRHKSNDYKKWIEIARAELLTQEKYTITGDEWLEVSLGFHTKIYNKNGSIKKKDLDNFSKATLDFLGDNVKGFKDENIKRLIMEKHESNENIVIINVREIYE